MLLRQPVLRGLDAQSDSFGRARARATDLRSSGSGMSDQLDLIQFVTAMLLLLLLSISCRKDLRQTASHIAQPR